MKACFRRRKLPKKWSDMASADKLGKGGGVHGHTVKRLSLLSSPAGMSLTKLCLAGII